MNADFSLALCAGAERLTAWADLLDRINVFPVPDGDTGMNLSVSLSPLKEMPLTREELDRRLLLSARGNSGNIAARFLSGFITAESPFLLKRAVAEGRDRAWTAVKNPREGTMLSVFDALNAYIDTIQGDFLSSTSGLMKTLSDTVSSTAAILPDCAAAGVVDSGALGMYIFFDGFFASLAGRDTLGGPPTVLFRDRLAVSPDFHAAGESCFCIDLVLSPSTENAGSLQELQSLGDSLVLSEENSLVKVHLHTRDLAETRRQVESMGNILRWTADDMGEQVRAFTRSVTEGCVHIVTDGAGSLTREDAASLGMTLLDNYILFNDRSVPETLVDRDELYDMMRRGTRVKTSQASLRERHSLFERIALTHDHSLYLCVGSAYTGNYAVAAEWAGAHTGGGTFAVLDSGAASGKLGLSAMATARYSRHAASPETVLAFARKASNLCREYLFIDTLKYLAEGGRVSKPGAFFGDLLHIRPVISPGPEGVEKITTVRSRDDQLEFLEGALTSMKSLAAPALVLLQYTDNRQWLMDNPVKTARHLLPDAEILVTPLSLTTGVHTGPGTWGVAMVAPENSFGST